jgi:hypothetical protein
MISKRHVKALCEFYALSKKKRYARDSDSNSVSSTPLIVTGETS